MISVQFTNRKYVGARNSRKPKRGIFFEMGIPAQKRELVVSLSIIPSLVAVSTPLCETAVIQHTKQLTPKMRNHVEYAGIRDESIHAQSVSRGEGEENGNIEMVAGPNVGIHTVATSPQPRQWQNLYGTFLNNRKMGPLLFVTIVFIGYLTFFLLLPPTSPNPNLAAERNQQKGKTLSNTPANFDITQLRPLISTQDVNVDIPSCRGCCGYPAILLYTYRGSEDIFAHVHHTFIDTDAAFLLVDQVTKGSSRSMCMWYECECPLLSVPFTV